MPGLPRAFAVWRAVVVFCANVPNLVLVAWLFFWVTRTGVGPVPGALPWNVSLFAAFAAVHSLTATTSWKRAFAALFPPAFERAAYVILAGVSLSALLFLWKPMPALIWRVEGIAGRLLDVAFWSALVLAWWTGRHFDQAAFVGTRQLSAHWRGTAMPAPEFVVTGPFRHARNPMYAAMLVLLWSASTLTAGRLLFNLLATAYFVLGARLEERRLAAAIGEPYRLYLRSVPMFLPRLTPWLAPASGAAASPAGLQDR